VFARQAMIFLEKQAALLI